MASGEQLTELWQAHARSVMAYSVRHVGAVDAEDVVSETFTTAWRRRDDIPDAALPWLLGVARNVIANRRRAVRRQDQLVDVVARLLLLAADVTPEDQDARVSAVHALAALTDIEREAVLLVGWDGLTPTEAARVVGCSVGAFHVRLLRARRHLDTLDGRSPIPMPTPTQESPS